MASANHVLLRRITLTTSAASVTFSGIPQTGYTDLKLVWSARNNASATIRSVQMRFNNNSSNIYSAKIIDGNGSSASSAGYANDVLFYWAGWANDTNSTANTFSNCEIYIPNYTSSNYKSVSMDAVAENNATTAYTRLEAGLWASTSAITEINMIGESDFLAGSSFSLYGIANAATTPASAPKADGGDIIKTDGTYWYHAFLSSGSFKPQVNLTCDALVVAGGGAGAGSFGAGGGAGGLLQFTSQSFTNTAYAVTVGAGGASNNSTRGANGSDSQLGSLTLVKGGGGGGIYGGGTLANGASGGSGGGGASDSPSRTGGSPTSGQGYAGGDVVGGLGTYYPNAGGGGAGGVGGSITSGSQAGGSGGVGLYSTLIDAMGSATTTGVLSSTHYYYAGGGGAGSFGGGGAGSGGTGGGGSGTSSTGSAGTPNTGGGGSGAGGNAGAYSGAGGSGIVIIRYAV